jgi:hypothetical protein
MNEDCVIQQEPCPKNHPQNNHIHSRLTISCRFASNDIPSNCYTQPLQVERETINTPDEPRFRLH